MSNVCRCTTCGQEFFVPTPNSRLCLRCLFERNVGLADENGCRDWNGARSKQGYGVLKLGGRQFKAHRVSLELSAGTIPDGMFVCHRCDRPSCVAPEHLFVGTPADNMADRDAKGRQATGARSGAHTHPESVRRGERNHKSKLSLEQVREARRLLANGKKHREVAAAFGVARTTISWIARGHTWKEAS